MESPKMVRLESNVGSMLFIEGSSIAKNVKRKRFHDRGVEYFMRKYQSYLFPFFDVGANVGLFSIIAALMGGDQESVIAFEPDQHNIEVFVQNISERSLKSIRIEPFACGSENGELRMGIIDCGLSSKSHADKRIVPCRSLGSYSTEAKIIPSFVKIDVEGGEVDVLRGLSANGNCADTILELEFSWRDHHTKIEDILRLRPMKRYCYEFLLTENDALLGDNTAIKKPRTLIRDVLTSQCFDPRLATTEEELASVLEVLKASSLERMSRKWELCVAPHSITRRTIGAPVSDFVLEEF